MVADAKNQGLQEPPLPEAWIPYTVTGSGERGILVRTANDPLAHLERGAQGDLGHRPQRGPHLHGHPRRTSSEQFSYAGPRFGFLLMSLFAGIGLLLVTIGVYSVIAYAIARQTHEIGIRMAIGAARGRRPQAWSWAWACVSWRSGWAWACWSASALARAIASQLWGVSPNDPLTVASVVLLLFATGLLACWVPARRATRVDPVVALRYE